MDDLLAGGQAAAPLDIRLHDVDQAVVDGEGERLAGRTENTMDNCRLAAQSGLKYGAVGFLKKTYNLFNVAITRAIVAMGKTLDLSIVAEGVENERQYTFLSSLGAIIGQGYYFSRPAPFSALPQVMHRWRRYALSELLEPERPAPPRLVAVAGAGGGGRRP